MNPLWLVTQLTLILGAYQLVLWYGVQAIESWYWRMAEKGMNVQSV